MQAMHDLLISGRIRGGGAGGRWLCVIDKFNAMQPEFTTASGFKISTSGLVGLASKVVLLRSSLSSRRNSPYINQEKGDTSAQVMNLVTKCEGHLHRNNPANRKHALAVVACAPFPSAKLPL
eukprot:1162032-Pelagomonas_calceolata.AAC.1